MKNLFLSMLFLLSLIFFLANVSEAAIECGTVDAKAAACVGFATGKDLKPTPACCSGLQQLAQSVKSVDDKKAICRCLKAGAKSLGVQDRFLSKIPEACNIKVGFPVSTTTNCCPIWITAGGNNLAFIIFLKQLLNLSKAKK